MNEMRRTHTKWYTSCIIEKSEEFQMPFAVSFIDFSKAFDSTHYGEYSFVMAFRKGYLKQEETSMTTPTAVFGLKTVSVTSSRY